MRLKKLFHFLLNVNLSQTIRLNFKMLPFSVAKKLPIWVYGNMTFRSLNGTLIIKGPVRTGMIKIGKNDYYVNTSVQQSIWTIRGTVIFNGPINFLQGSYVLVSNNATLTFGSNGTLCGSNMHIMCFEKINIGDNVRLAWECQVMDTSFHYIELLNINGEIKPLTKPVFIGDRVWIGNRTTISKGAVIPNDTIVASNSLVNRNFFDIEPYSMLAGSPALLKGTGFRRIFDEERQRELDKQFHYTRTHL